MSKYAPLILLIVFSNAQDNSFHIELTNERDYPVFINETGDYNIKAGKTQRVFKVNGITNNSKVERIEWKTKNAFSWNDGTRSEDFPVVNSLTYTKNGVDLKHHYINIMRRREILSYCRYYRYYWSGLRV